MSARDGRRPATDTAVAPSARSRPDACATDWLKPVAGGVSLLIAASPRASRTEVAGVAEGRLRIRVAAPPVEGAANEELVRFLARSLGVPKRAVAVTAGAGGRRKTVLVKGVAEAAARRLAPGDAPGA